MTTRKLSSEERYYRTTSFHLASFLFSKGCELVNIDRIADQKRATFVFGGNERAEELAHEFSFGKEDDEAVLIDARKLIYSTKSLKEKLYQDRF